MVDEELLRKSVTEFIQQLNLRDVTLVGESIGAVLALTVSAELPDRVVRAVALNPYDYSEKFGGGIRRSGNGWIIGLFDVFGSYTIEPKFLLAAVFRGGFYDPLKLPPDLLDELYRTGLRDGYRGAEYSIMNYPAARPRGIKTILTAVAPPLACLDFSCSFPLPANFRVPPPWRHSNRLSKTPLPIALSSPS